MSQKRTSIRLPSELFERWAKGTTLSQPNTLNLAMRTKAASKSMVAETTTPFHGRRRIYVHTQTHNIFYLFWINVSLAPSPLSRAHKHAILMLRNIDRALYSDCRQPPLCRSRQQPTEPFEFGFFFIFLISSSFGCNNNKYTESERTIVRVYTYTTRCYYSAAIPFTI